MGKLKVAWNFLRNAVYLISHGYKLRDKLALLGYFLGTPLYAFSYLRGKKYNQKLKSDIFVKTPGGIFNCGNDINTALTAMPGYEKQVQDAMYVNEGCFIDVGSSIGVHAIRMARILRGHGSVIAFEPEPRSFSILKQNIQINNLDNVTPINKGCFDKKAFLTFFVLERGSGGHSLIKPSINAQKIKIGVDTLDNILSRIKPKKVSAIKIDVEGAESNVLKGAMKTIKKHKPKIIIEAWNENYLNKSKKVLSSLGYKCKQLDETNYLFVK
jgi:FkbM family methyltransferase